jgi:hypothetical protein
MLRKSTIWRAVGTGEGRATGVSALLYLLTMSLFAVGGIFLAVHLSVFLGHGGFRGLLTIPGGQ